jgi:AcrR family transcriptional regulator
MTARPDTKTRILDAAEKLFGEKGFDATSLRDITAEADVNLAAVNYHFQSKESLIDAAILRRALPVNNRRLAMLAEAGPQPSVEAIVEAFVAPLLEVDMDSMAMLMARVLSNPDVVERVFRDHMTALASRFVDALGAVLPDVSPAELQWRLHFIGGAMAHTVTRGPLLRDIFGMDFRDRKLLTQRLVRFAAAGLRASEVTACAH